MSEQSVTLAIRNMRYAAIVVVVAHGGVPLPQSSLCCALAALASARRALLTNAPPSSSCPRIALTQNVTASDVHFLRRGGAVVRDAAAQLDDAKLLQKWPEPLVAFLLKLLPVGWTEFDGVLVTDWDLFFERQPKSCLLYTSPSPRDS